MLLLVHIVIAFSGILFSGLSLFSPSKRKLTASYVLVVSTFFTGSLLVMLKPAHLVASCISGLVYLGFVGLMLLLASRKLAREANA